MNLLPMVHYCRPDVKKTEEHGKLGDTFAVVWCTHDQPCVLNYSHADSLFAVARLIFGETLTDTAS